MVILTKAQEKRLKRMLIIYFGNDLKNHKELVYVLRHFLANELTYQKKEILERIEKILKTKKEKLKEFELVRIKDESGVSGTGSVAWGVEFPDGICVLRWKTAGGSTEVYDNIESVKKIHGQCNLDCLVRYC